MCGIAGFYGRHSPDSDRIRQCLALMGRRGPDSTGQFVTTTADGTEVCLLHSRLNIIDPDERSNQPFRIGDSALVYNGELYNYLEIRRALDQEGAAFVTDGDTEVLAQALYRWGVAGFDRLEGMWAFARFDGGDGSLLLCRDRFGEKPLYVHWAAEGLYFGSEIKFLFALMGRRLPINENHLRRNLVNGYKAIRKGSEQYFHGVDVVPPGMWLRVTPGAKASSGRYWTPSFRPDDSLSYGDAVAATRDALIRAVELRLRGDVPLAFCMSGGVDSNSLISIAKRIFDYDVHGFTIVNEDERYEEQSVIDASVRDLGIKHTEIPVRTDGFLERLRRQVVAHDGPVCTITYYAQWMLLEAIAEAGYRVSISGTGADELFSGYFDHHLFYLASIRDGDAAEYETAVRNWETWIKPIVRNPHLQDAEVFVRDPAFRDHIYLNADAFSGWLTEPWQEPFSEERFCEDPLRNRMLNEMFHEAVPPILHEDDLNAMYYSVENRSPFLDRSLFDTAFRIPTRHLVQRGYAKVVLRDAMRGIVPDAVLDSHRKVGFNAPIFSYLDRSDPAVRDEVLADSPVFDLIRRDRVETLLAKDAIPNSESKLLFNFLCAKMFMEEFAA